MRPLLNWTSIIASSNAAGQHEGYRWRVTCPMGDFLRDRLGIGVTGCQHGSGPFYYPFYLPGVKMAG
ncbi:hypothetical protein EVAR_50068_1 [Eumeta japonica]|uniref:Uncharacterized protein n=1 Tax=Eumeta variegata TaxID=151549 RepID=A0A4C1XLI0_EUMVA|nr:hypothetical protein EVAR_50068_1 [Eumeta japonica]